MSTKALTDTLSFIVSWIVLLAVGVIVSGKLLGQKLKINAGTGQLFRIPIKGIFTIQATGGEVVLGVSFYLVCILFLGWTVGASLQPWVKSHFGLDPGQFNALGFMSSLTSVALSSAVFLLSKIPAPARERASVQRRDRIVDELANKNSAEKKSDDEMSGEDNSSRRGTR